jgi:hypothetical protein
MKRNASSATRRLTAAAARTAPPRNTAMAAGPTNAAGVDRHRRGAGVRIVLRGNMRSDMPTKRRLSMTEKTDFQPRVLKKYGVIPVFDGQPEYVNVKTSVPGETFNQWCARVLGKKANEVRLLSLVDTTPQKGNARIGKLASDAEYLKKIIRDESRRCYLTGMLKSRLNGETDTQSQQDLVKPNAIGRDELFATLADAVPNRTPAVDEFFGHFADSHASESSWIELFEALARQYAQLADFKKRQFKSD